MKLIKCPICELNYMAENESMCEVCKQERKKSRKKSEPVVQICPECNENPVEPGEEFCRLCLREHKRLEAIEKLAMSRQTDTDEEDQEVLPGAMLPEEPAEELENIELLQDDDTDIPEEELEDIEEELGLDDEDEEDGLAL